MTRIDNARDEESTRGIPTRVAPDDPYWERIAGLTVPLRELERLGFERVDMTGDPQSDPPREVPVTPTARELYDVAARANLVDPQADDAVVLEWLQRLGEWEEGASHVAALAASKVESVVEDVEYFLGVDARQCTALLETSTFFLIHDETEYCPSCSAELLHAIFAQMERVFRREEEVEAWLDSRSDQNGMTWRGAITGREFSRVLDALRALPSDLPPVALPEQQTMREAGNSDANAQPRARTAAEIAETTFQPMELIHERREQDIGSRRRAKADMGEVPSDYDANDAPVRLGRIAQVIVKSMKDSDHARLMRLLGGAKTTAHRFERDAFAFERDFHRDRVVSGEIRDMLASPIADIRWRFGLSDDEIAEIVGDERPPVLRAWLTGASAPSFDEWQRLRQLQTLTLLYRRVFGRRQAAYRAGLAEEVPFTTAAPPRHRRRAEPETRPMSRRSLLFLGLPGLDVLWNEALGDRSDKVFREWRGTWYTRAAREAAAAERARGRRASDYNIPYAIMSAVPDEDRAAVQALVNEAVAVANASTPSADATPNVNAIIQALTLFVETGGKRPRKRTPKAAATSTGSGR